SRWRYVAESSTRTAVRAGSRAYASSRSATASSRSPAWRARRASVRRTSASVPVEAASQAASSAPRPTARARMENERIIVRGGEGVEVLKASGDAPGHAAPNENEDPKELPLSAPRDPGLYPGRPQAPDAVPAGVPRVSVGGVRPKRRARHFTITSRRHQVTPSPGSPR